MGFALLIGIHACGSLCDRRNTEETRKMSSLRFSVDVKAER